MYNFNEKRDLIMKSSISFVVWNGSVVFLSVDESEFKRFLKEVVGMDDEFIEENMDCENLDMSEEEMDEMGWKWGVERGDDSVSIGFGWMKDGM